MENMSDERERYRMVMEDIAPLLALEHVIRAETALRPTAIMLPLSVFPDLEEISGFPIVRGDRRALIFEPETFQL